MKKFNNFSSAAHLGISGHSNLDFIDIPVNTDASLYIHPLNIQYANCEFSNGARESIQTFFAELFKSCKSRDYKKMAELLSYGGEPNEVHLGSSRNYSRGKGSSVEILMPIFLKMIKDGLFDTGVELQPADIYVFARNFDKDRMADLLVNVIRGDLWLFTSEQAIKYGIPMSNEVPYAGAVWEPNKKRWETKIWPSLEVDKRPVLLTPKQFVVQHHPVSAQWYLRNCVLEYRQKNHLDNQTELCRRRRDKNGNIIILEPFKQNIIESEVFGQKVKEYNQKMSCNQPDLINDLHKKINGFSKDYPHFMTNAELDCVLYGAEEKEA